jgi:hypothetical protein
MQGAVLRTRHGRFGCRRAPAVTDSGTSPGTGHRATPVRRPSRAPPAMFRNRGASDQPVGSKRRAPGQQGFAAARVSPRGGSGRELKFAPPHQYRNLRRLSPTPLPDGGYHESRWRRSERADQRPDVAEVTLTAAVAGHGGGVSLPRQPQAQPPRRRLAPPCPRRQGPGHCPGRRRC